MKTVELQILSGLHAGVRLPLNKTHFTLGGGEGVDARLLDDEFDGVTLVFDRLESGAFRLESSEDFRVISEEGQVLSAALPLDVGGFMLVGGVWIALQAAGAPMVSVPTIIEPEAALDLDDNDHGLANGHESSYGNAADSAALADANEASVGGKNRRLGKAAAGFVGGVLSILVVGLGFAWMPSEAHTASTAGGKPVVSPVAATLATPATPVATASKKGESTRDQGAREVVADLLKEHGLQKPVALRVGYGEISLTGALRGEQLRKFERVIEQIEARFGSDFQVSANIETIQTAPKFRIREVVSGKDGWIVTAEDERVIVGGEIGGYRLMSVEGNRVVLVGPDRIEIQL